MNVMVVGAGGREHALVWEIEPSSLAKKLSVYAARFKGSRRLKG